MIQELIGNLRIGARMMSRTPGFTVVALLTMALGIGANTAIFSLVSGVLLKPLPFPEAERIVEAYEASPNGLAVVDGRLVEAPVVRAMRRRLALAAAARA